MSTRKFRTLITDIGLAKLAATTAPGGKPVRLTHMAVGDGNGELRQPQKNQTSLYNEVWRQSVNRVFTDPENPNRLIAELVIPPETGGFWVREIGVFDDTGTMIAVGNTAESYKPTREEGSGRAQIFRAVITVTSDAVVELVMDTTTILPTTDYIDEKIAEHARSRNHPDATLTEKGFTQLSSDTNSNSETLAATPRAVKAAYDLAASKAAAAHTHRWAQITDAPVFSSVARVIMGKQSIKDILDYFGLGEGSTLPVGVPVPWPSSRPPEGWLQCNGAAFTRTKYPKLAVAYPDLRLPDLRGEFIRGWDDLRMIDRGRLLLSTQEATYICTAIQAYHGVAGGADIQAGISFASHDNDIINITPDQPRTGNGILYGTKPVDRWAIARAGKLVSNEKDRWIAIRPRNIAFNYIVRAV